MLKFEVPPGGNKKNEKVFEKFTSSGSYFSNCV